MPTSVAPRERPANMGVSVNRLPLELLTFIFWLTIQDEGALAVECTNQIARTLILCSVCSFWRSVIISNPSFWSRIPVEDTIDSQDLTRLTLERSKESPIDVVIRLYDSSVEKEWPCEQDLFLHSSRIRSIYILGVTNEHMVSLLGRVMGNQLPELLTTLSIKTEFSDRSSDGIDEEDIIARYESMLGNITALFNQLQALELDGVSLPDFRGWEKSNFGKLRELVLSGLYVSARDVLYIMDIASNLQLLEFYDPVEWMSDTTILKPVLRLDQGFKILRLHGLPPTMLRAAIMPITPGVWESEMRIETREPKPLEAHSNWSAVTALTLDNNKGPIHVGGYLPKILATLPNLHSLTLENFELVEPTLSGLTKPHDTVDDGFPKISVLRLHHSRVRDHEAFKSVIRSHPLRRLEIRDCALEWGGNGTYGRDANSPLYSWLAEQVPELYVTGH